MILCVQAALVYRLISMSFAKIQKIIFLDDHIILNFISPMRAGGDIVEKFLLAKISSCVVLRRNTDTLS